MPCCALSRIQNQTLQVRMVVVPLGVGLMVRLCCTCLPCLVAVLMGTPRCKPDLSSSLVPRSHAVSDTAREYQLQSYLRQLSGSPRLHVPLTSPSQRSSPTVFTRMLQQNKSPHHSASQPVGLTRAHPCCAGFSSHLLSTGQVDLATS